MDRHGVRTNRWSRNARALPDCSIGPGAEFAGQQTNYGHVRARPDISERLVDASDATRSRSMIADISAHESSAALLVIEISLPPTPPPATSRRRWRFQGGGFRIHIVKRIAVERRRIVIGVSERVGPGI